MSRRRIDIIGAGISGLAVAFELSKKTSDVEIHVWEKDNEPGGLAGTFSTPTYTVEKFYHHLFTRDVALQTLIAELKLGQDLMWKRATTGSYYVNSHHRLSSPLDLLRYKPLPWLDRFRLGWLVLRAQSAKSWQELDTISAKDFVVRHAGKNVYETVWEPLLTGKFGSEAKNISAAWLWSKMVDRGGSRDKEGREVLGYLRGGLGRVFTAMVERIRAGGHHVHFGQPVIALKASPHRIEKLCIKNQEFDADMVIGCGQLPDLVNILPDATREYRDQLSRIKFLSNVCLVLTLKESLSNFYWTNVIDAKVPFVGVIEQTRWAQRSDFNQQHLVYISVYVPPDDVRMALSAEEILERYRPHIERMFPKFRRDHILDVMVWKAPYAQPMVTVGYSKLIPDIVSPIENFWLCTMAQIYPHDRQVSNGVEMAMKTVERIMEKLKVPT